MSWSIGGKDDWRTFLTLPNIIKEFNPNVYGYSVASDSLGFQKASKFNVAEPSKNLIFQIHLIAIIKLLIIAAISFHTIRQAKNLVKRMRSDGNVDMKRNWKLITIMIGACY